jgi:hypothetical protein
VPYGVNQLSSIPEQSQARDRQPHKIAGKQNHAFFSIFSKSTAVFDKIHLLFLFF